MKTRIYLDCADVGMILDHADDDTIQGFTTNPLLAQQAGVTRYLDFARQAVIAAGSKPVSLEVVADDPVEMIRQAEILDSLGTNVYVKIPVVCTDGTPTTAVVSLLAEKGVKVNVTAVMSGEQIQALTRAWYPEDVPGIVSVFAGRVADIGRNPVSLVNYARRRMPNNVRVLWASAREIYNYVQAVEAEADIITLTPALYAKYERMTSGMDPEKYSRLTVHEFWNAAQAAGLKL